MDGSELPRMDRSVRRWFGIALACTVIAPCTAFFLVGELLHSWYWALLALLAFAAVTAWIGYRRADRGRS